MTARLPGLFARLLVAGALLASAAVAAEVRVGAGDSLAEALATVADGDTVRVIGGVHPGPLIVAARIDLVGEQWPVLDGGGRGTVLSIRVPGTRVEGFRVVGSGSLLDQENSGIAVEAADVQVVGNRLDDVLFGIYLRAAGGSRIERNRIRGKALALPRRGDAIRVWYSDGAAVVDNVVEDGRDVVLWYSSDLAVLGNRVSGGRYGLHFMYCDDAEIRGNLLVDNSVGAFLMYSRRLRLVGNTIGGNHGPSGYGVGLKDMDDAQIRGNLFVGNRVGAFLDNSPRESRSKTIIEGNSFAGNDLGVVLLPNVRRAELVDNAFVENPEQVSVAGGGGDAEANLWRGNFWSDYSGYDDDGDGFGELPYRAERLYEMLADRHPVLRLFLHSPATGALDFAAHAFPVVRPRPKLTDPRPRMRPVALAGLPAVPRPGSRPWGFAAAALLAAAGALSVAPRWLSAGRRATPPAVAGETEAIVSARGLAKRFGGVTALAGIDFAIAPGEAVALWGPNGAGKTTALRAMLGVLRFEGRVRVAGFDPLREGKEVRRRIGFVPQESGLQGDLTGYQALDFFARLRRVPEARSDELADWIGIAGHLDKRVRELSGGLRQRLGLAIALLDDPPILMLDEPTANLDAAGRAAFYQLLLDLKAAGKTLIFTSHRIEEVRLLADRVLSLEDGLLASDGPPEAMPASAARIDVAIRLPDDRLEAGEAALREDGFEVRRIGPSLLVSLPGHRKVEPLVRLVARGLEPLDVAFTERSEAGGRVGDA